MYRINLPNNRGQKYAESLFHAEGLAYDVISGQERAQIDARIRGKWVPFGSVSLKRGFCMYQTACKIDMRELSL